MHGIYILLLEYTAFYFIFKNLYKNQLFFFGGGILFIFNVLLSIMLVNTGFRPFWYSRIFAFNFGVFLAVYEERIRLLICRHQKSITFVAILLIWLWFLNPTARLAFFMDNIMPLLLYLLCVFYNFSEFKAFRVLGKYSMEIYLLHGIFLYIAKQYIQ